MSGTASIEPIIWPSRLGALSLVLEDSVKLCNNRQLFLGIVLFHRHEAELLPVLSLLAGHRVPPWLCEEPYTIEILVSSNRIKLVPQIG